MNFDRGCRPAWHHIAAIPVLLAGVFLLLATTALAGDRFPGKTWLSYATPEEAGFSSEKLAEAKQVWESLQSAGVMVVYDGAVLVAWGDVERRYLLHSARKSIMSGLYGIHVDRKNIDLGRTMEELGIDDENPPLNQDEKQATIFDLIRARSGVYHPAAAEPPTNPKPPRGSHAPGTFWCYNNWDFNALCTILEQESDIKVFEEFKKCFADPLAMEDFRVRDGIYMYERQKSIHPAYHIRMSARDMARFGLLYLNEGKWEGEQILSQEWVRESTRSHSEASRGDGYGYMWWVSGKEPFKELGMYSALGVGLQSIDIVPGLNMVFVHRVNTYDRKKVSDDERLDLLRMIVDARTGDAKKNPRLLPLARVPRTFEPIELTMQEMKALCSSPTDPSSAQVIFEDGEMLLDSSQGKIGIIPIRDGKFVIEDLHHEIFFEKNSDGSIQRVITEGSLNDHGYELLAEGKMDEAIAIFKKAVAYYPESSNVYDSLAEAYAENDDLERAIETYQRLLRVDPENAHAAAMIERLELRMNPVVVPEETLKSYVGQYGRLSVLIEERVLYAQRQNDSKRFRLVPMSEQLFMVEGVDYPRFRFITDEHGMVAAIEFILEKDRTMRVDRDR